MSQFNMAAQLEQWSKNKVCSVIQLFNERTVPAIEIHHQLKDVYGKYDMSQQCAAKWYSEF
jgi:hypothetical protein